MTSVDLQKMLLSEEDISTRGVAQSLSAYMDDQGHSREINLAESQVTHCWSQYHVIRDALTDPSSLAPVSESFAARMSAALAREPAHGQSDRSEKPVASPRPSFWERAGMAWPGLAMASAVASVVWIAQPLLGLQESVGEPGVVQEVAARPAAAADRGTGPTADYVSAHRHMAGTIAPRHVAYTGGGQ